MARPKEGYKLQDGTKAPGVTTICNRFKESGGLIYWAWQQGKDGKDFREERDAAAEAGTLAHLLVEAYLRGQPEPQELAAADSDIGEKARQGFANWLAWKEQSNLNVTAWEEPIVCEHYRYGGTPDAIAWDAAERLAVVDWKSSNAIYVETLLQLAAYRHLFMDRLLPGGDGRGASAGFHICKFAKETADFAHYYFAELDGAWEMFLALRQAFELDKELKKRVR